MTETMNVAFMEPVTAVSLIPVLPISSEESTDLQTTQSP